MDHDATRRLPFAAATPAGPGTPEGAQRPGFARIEPLEQGVLRGVIGYGTALAPGGAVDLWADDHRLMSFLPRRASPGDDEARRGPLYRFAVLLPETVRDGEVRVYVLRARETGLPLDGGQFQARVAPPAASGVAGRLVRLRGMQAEGWAIDLRRPRDSVAVEILNRGETVACGVTGWMTDIVSGEDNDPLAAVFRVPLPPVLLDGRPLELQARVVGTGAPLTGGVASTPAAINGLAVTLDAVDGRDLAGSIERDVTASAEPVRLDLWIDGLYAESITLDLGARSGQRLRFVNELPLKVRDRRFENPVLDGQAHVFALTPAGGSRVLAHGRLRTPAVTGSLPFLDRVAGFDTAALPPAIDALVKRICASSLFDASVYGRQRGKQFPDAASAALDYLAAREHWSVQTSAWLDPAFVLALKPGHEEAVSPLEWYLRQPPSADVGPNPWFSNRDCVALGRWAEAEVADAVSCFDHWLLAVRAGRLFDPLALVSLEYLAAQLGGDGPTASDTVLNWLVDWIRTPGRERDVARFSPYFDATWLEQSFLMRRNRPAGCLLSAARLGRFVDQSPHPLLQAPTGTADYFSRIRAYEIRFATAGYDDIASLAPHVDAAALARRFPTADADVGAPARSAFYRYALTAGRRGGDGLLATVSRDYVERFYPGLLAFCEARRGITDLDYLWARWLRLLRVPVNYREGAGGNPAILSARDMDDLRRFDPRVGDRVRASFVVPSYGRDDLVLRCVLSAVQSGDVNGVEFVVAEDAPHLDAGWLLAYFLPFARILRNPENLGFLKNCNAAVERTAGEIVVLVNNDVVLHRDSLEETLDVFDSRPDAGVVGGLVLNQDGSIQENGGIVWQDGSAWNYHRNVARGDEYLFNRRESDYVSGCWFAVRRSLWQEIGGFDLRYAPAYYEETAFCMACRELGWKVFVNPHAVVTHLDGATMGANVDDPGSLKSTQAVNREKFAAHWQARLLASMATAGNPSAFHCGRRDDPRFVTLIFDHYIPEPDRDAGSRTMWVVCEALAAVEDNYVVFVPANFHRTAYAVDLERQGIEVLTGVAGRQRLDALVRYAPDRIHYAFVSRTAVARQFARHLEQLRCRRTLYLHDIEALRQFRHDPSHAGHAGLVDAAVAHYVDRYRGLFDGFDHILSLSDEETRLLAPWYASRLVDAFPYEFVEATAAPPEAEVKDILFVGSYNHPPNREAIGFFLAAVWPTVRQARPRACLHLCGSGFERSSGLAGDGVVLHGAVTDGTLAYLYRSSRVAVAPLLSGAGMKGKVVEAWAHGRLCVGTDLAWQGIALPSALGLLSGTPGDFAERLIAVYDAWDRLPSQSLREVFDAEIRGRGIRQVVDGLAREAHLLASSGHDGRLRPAASACVKPGGM